VSDAPELQAGETAVAYFNRLHKAYATLADFTGALALNRAATMAALAVADRNEGVQRALLAEVKALNGRLDKLLPPV